MFAAESHLSSVTHYAAFGTWQRALCVVGATRKKETWVGTSEIQHRSICMALV